MFQGQLGKWPRHTSGRSFVKGFGFGRRWLGRAIRNVTRNWIIVDRATQFKFQLFNALTSLVQNADHVDDPDLKSTTMSNGSELLLLGVINRSDHKCRTRLERRDSRSYKWNDFLLFLLFARLCVCASHNCSDHRIPRNFCLPTNPN